MPGIFISYRRDDSAGHAGRIFDRLRQHFGEEKVFMDVADIEPGVDFVEAIDHAVGACDVLLVIIGRQWLTCSDSAGKRRLDDPKDFIRLETGTALRREIRVIPVLVQGATMPSEEQLPEDLKKLARRQATDISDNHWDAGVEQLIAALTKLLPSKAGMTETAKATPSQQQKAPPGSGQKGPWIIAAVAAVVLLALAVIYYINIPQEVEVPDLIGKSLDQAQSRLNQAHLKLGDLTREPSDQPVNSVIEQRPAPGSQVERDSIVNLLLAEPRPPEIVTVEMPELLGQPLEKALLTLKSVGLFASEPVRVKSGAHRSDSVIEQTPDAGTKLERGTVVGLVVADRPQEASKVEMPNLINLNIKAALNALQQAGVKAKPHLRKLETTTAAPDTVLKQSIRPGSLVDTDAAIDLTYAVAAVDTLLPDFSGWPVTKVEEYLLSKGLVLDPVRNKETNDARPGTVLAQRPAANSAVKRGASVSLMVAVSPGQQQWTLPAPIPGTRQRLVPESQPESIILYWKPVAGASSYTIELDYYISGRWSSEEGKTRIIRGIEADEYRLPLRTTNSARWRIWAVGKDRSDGEKSEWQKFSIAR